MNRAPANPHPRPRVSPATDILASLGLDAVLDEPRFEPADGGLLRDSAGDRVVVADTTSVAALHHVLEHHRAGAWRLALKASGRSCGQRVAARLDARLATLGKPALAALPLEACLVFIERFFAAHGWGRLKLDLTHAGHQLVVARLEGSYFVAALPHANDFVDSLPAGVLQGYFEHITGQALGCEEVECARRATAGAPPPGHCTFVLTPSERLAEIMPRLGTDSADALIAQLGA